MPYGRVVLDWKARVTREGRYTARHGRREIAEQNVLDEVKAIFETTAATTIFVNGYTFKTSSFPRCLARFERDGKCEVYPVFLTGLLRARFLG